MKRRLKKNIFFPISFRSHALQQQQRQQQQTFNLRRDKNKVMNIDLTMTNVELRNEFIFFILQCINGCINHIYEKEDIRCHGGLWFCIIIATNDNHPIFKTLDFINWDWILPHTDHVPHTKYKYKTHVRS